MPGPQIRARPLLAAVLLAVGVGVGLPSTSSALPAADMLTCTFNAAGSYDGTDDYTLASSAGSLPNQCLHTDADGLAGLDPDGANHTAVIPMTMYGEGRFTGALCTGQTRWTATHATPTDGEVATLVVTFDAALVLGSGVAVSVSGTVNPAAGNANPVRSAVALGFVHFQFGTAPSCMGNTVTASGAFSAVTTS